MKSVHTPFSFTMSLINKYYKWHLTFVKFLHTSLFFSFSLKKTRPRWCPIWKQSPCPPASCCWQLKPCPLTQAPPTSRTSWQLLLGELSLNKERYVCAWHIFELFICPSHLTFQLHFCIHRAVTDSINQLITMCTQQAPGQKECDNALRELEVTTIIESSTRFLILFFLSSCFFQHEFSAETKLCVLCMLCMWLCAYLLCLCAVCEGDVGEPNRSRQWTVVLWLYRQCHGELKGRTHTHITFYYCLHLFFSAHSLILSLFLFTSCNLL